MKRKGSSFEAAEQGAKELCKLNPGNVRYVRRCGHIIEAYSSINPKLLTMPKGWHLKHYRAYTKSGKKEEHYEVSNYGQTLNGIYDSFCVYYDES